MVSSNVESTQGPSDRDREKSLPVENTEEEKERQLGVLMKKFESGDKLKCVRVPKQEQRNAQTVIDEMDD